MSVFNGAYLLRRKKLGLTSCREISNNSKTGITFVRNDGDIPVEPELCIRWGCTSNVPQKKVLNTAKAIHLVSNKTEFRKILMDHWEDGGHLLCPETWFQPLDERITFPCIVRPQNHHQGRNFHYCEDRKQLHDAWVAVGDGGYISEYIEKEEEFRVFIVQGLVVCVAKKTPDNPDAKAWNVARGGRFDNVRWDNWKPNILSTAIIAFKQSGLDFGGVDVMWDGGISYVLEINSAPSLTSPYRQQCMAKAFDYIVENGKDPLDLRPYNGWRHYIHPAIWSRK